MGSNHTKAASAKSKGKQADASQKTEQCVTQASDSGTISPEPRLDTKLYRMKKAAKRKSSPEFLGAHLPKRTEVQRSWESQGQDIDVEKAAEKRPRRSLLNIRLQPLAEKQTPEPEQPAVWSKPVKSSKRKYLNPTKLLLERHLQQQHSTSGVEFEEESLSQTFFPSNKETRHTEPSEPVHSTYKIAQVRRKSHVVTSESDTRRESGIISLLREAAAAKYEAQKRDGGISVHEFAQGRKPQSGLTSALNSPGLLRTPGSTRDFEEFADNRLQDARYKIKSVLSMKLTTGKQFVQPKTPARLWKGRCGSLLVPVDPARQ